MLSSRMDVEEGVVNYKGTRNPIYEGGEGGCVGVGGEAGMPMRIRISLLFTFFHVQHSVWGSHVETCTKELRRILYCCISVQVLVLQWQWSLLAKYFSQCVNFCLKNSRMVELKEWYPLSGAAPWRELPAGKFVC